MKALLAFRTLFARQSNGFALALILSFVTLAAGVALLATSGWFITATALTTLGLAFNLFVPSAMVRGFSFLRILARYGERLTGHNATLHLLSNLRGWLFTRLFPRLPLADRSLRHGDLVSRLTADVDALDTAFLVAIGPIFAALLIGCTLTAALTFLLPTAALLYGACFALAILVVPAGLITTSHRTGKHVITCSADARAAVLDSIEGHADLAAFGVLGTAQSAFSATARRLAQARLHLATLTASAGFIVQTLAGLTLTGSLWLGLSAFSNGAIDGPVLAGLLLAIMGSFEAINVIVRSVGKLTTAIAAAERLGAIAESPTTGVDPADTVPFPADTTIAITNLVFSHGGPLVLDGLNLTITPGEHVAITGPSGVGKSSLLALLLRLADPSSGSILLGGVPLSRLRQTDLHANMALLGQSSPLFNDTIRANLLIARETADEAALWSVLDAAGIGDFVRGLPQGLDTLLGESARTISSGQARRLCLARTLLSSARILLLDEPTASLDRATEIAFFETLRQTASDRTVIIVTHAAIPTRAVDRILTLRQGRLD